MIDCELVGVDIAFRLCSDRNTLQQEYGYGFRILIFNTMQTLDRRADALQNSRRINATFDFHRSMDFLLL